MKANKGFTLIELLAVIVILAIIALIATPLIMGVIADARKGAAKDAALGYVKAIENQLMLDELNGTNALVGVSGGNGTVTTTGLNINGTAPETVSVTVSDYKITGGTIKVGVYTYTITANGDASLSS